MSTEATKRKQTLSILDKLRREGMPTRASQPDVGEEDAEQADFDEQEEARTQQDMLNRMQPSGPVGTLTELQLGMKPGPTGLGSGSAPGMVPYSPEEYEKRRRFRSKFDQTSASASRPAGRK